jgi:ribulose bisphosphate carboxylase small subunit
MSQPSTFRGESQLPHGIEWDQDATLHQAGDAGVLAELKVLRHGHLADLIRYIALLPAAQREQYEIERTGHHRIKAEEAMELYNHPGFPHADA